MVKLVGNDTMEEIEAYFNYENNFPQLLEDYLEKSGEIQKQLNKSKCKDEKKFIRNQRCQLKKLYYESNRQDEDKPRIKLFKTWRDNLYEQKKMRYHKKDSDLEKDNLISSLKNQVLEMSETIIQLKNENKFYLKKIKKLKKSIKSQSQPKPEPKPALEPKPQSCSPEPEPTPEPEPKPEPPQEPKEEPKEEPKIDSVYCNHLTEKEEEEKDDREQMIKAECERKAREREEHIENKNKIDKILETYYSQCDLKMDVIYKKFIKEVKKADRTNKNIKNDYMDEYDMYLEDLRDEYLEEHDGLSPYLNAMFDKPSRIFEGMLPSEMIEVPCMNKPT